MKLTATLPLALILALSVASPTTARQAAETADYSERVDVNEVLLDVLVTDRDGNVITGLDRDDFVVEEGDGAVELTGSAFYSNRELLESAQAAATKPEPGEVSEDRYFIFLLHDQRIDNPQLTRNYLELARRTENWIRTELLPNDWVAVARYDYKLKVHTDFTRDNEKLVQAVHDAARGKNPQEAWPSRSEEGRAQGPSLLAHLPTGKDLRKQTTRIYSGLEVLAGALGDVVGRKNLLFFSAGFGEETGLGILMPDTRYYDDTVEALNDSNVAVYSISVLTGLDFAGTTQALAQSLQNTMSVLANDTGGDFFSNHLAFDSPLDRVLSENSGYYLLSYRSETPAGEIGYRKVSVTTKNPEFRVKAREGYRFGT